MPGTVVLGGVANLNQKFLDTAEKYDQFIQVRSRKQPMVFFDRIPKGSADTFGGLIRKTNIWHGTLGPQMGLAGWNRIQLSRASTATDPGHDNCGPITPETFTHSAETIQYAPMRKHWQSSLICLEDIKYIEEGAMQAGLIMGAASTISQLEWERWNRENYMRFIIEAGGGYILSGGGLDYGTGHAKFSYDPFTTDADGDYVLTYPSDVEPSTLEWSYFDWWQDMLGEECPEGALAQKSGMPVFGMMVHLRDFDRMLRTNPDLREDVRYARPQILLDDYRNFDEFRGWGLIHDARQMRFKIKKVVGTTVTAKRVAPFRYGRAATIGNIPEANPEYQDAELAVGVVWMRNVFMNLIPAPVTSLGNGMVFGSALNSNGKFVWINEYDREINIDRSTGFFLAKFEAFPKPLENYAFPVAFLYKRCPQALPGACAVEAYDVTETGAIAVAEAAVSGDVDSTNLTVTLTLASRLRAGLGATVTITPRTGTPVTAIIADASRSPTYVFATTNLQSNTYTNFALGTTVTVV